MNSDNFSKEISVFVKTELNNVVLSPLFVVVNILNNIVEQFVPMLFNIVQRLCNIVHNYQQCWQHNSSIDRYFNLVYRYEYLK